MIIRAVDEGAWHCVTGMADAGRLQSDLASLCDQTEPPLRPMIQVHTLEGQPVIVAEVPEVPHSQKPRHQADGPDQAVLKFVAEGVLIPEFVMAQVAELDERLSWREPWLQGRVEELRRRLGGVDKSISILLDLAEQFGAASAGARLLEREAERQELLAELEQMDARQQAQSLTEPPDAVQVMPKGMQETLSGADMKAKQALLKKLAGQF